MTSCETQRGSYLMELRTIGDSPRELKVHKMDYVSPSGEAMQLQ